MGKKSDILASFPEGNILSLSYSDYDRPTLAPGDHYIDTKRFSTPLAVEILTFGLYTDIVAKFPQYIKNARTFDNTLPLLLKANKNPFVAIYKRINGTPTIYLEQVSSFLNNFIKLPKKDASIKQSDIFEVMNAPDHPWENGTRVRIIGKSLSTSKRSPKEEYEYFLNHPDGGYNEGYIKQIMRDIDYSNEPFYNVNSLETNCGWFFRPQDLIYVAPPNNKTSDILEHFNRISLFDIVKIIGKSIGNTSEHNKLRIIGEEGKVVKIFAKGTPDYEREIAYCKRTFGTPQDSLENNQYLYLVDIPGSTLLIQAEKDVQLVSRDDQVAKTSDILEHFLDNAGDFQIDTKFTYLTHTGVIKDIGTKKELVDKYLVGKSANYLHSHCSAKFRECEDNTFCFALIWLGYGNTTFCYFTLDEVKHMFRSITSGLKTSGQKDANLHTFGNVTNRMVSSNGTVEKLSPVGKDMSRSGEIVVVGDILEKWETEHTYPFKVGDTIDMAMTSKDMYHVKDVGRTKEEYQKEYPEAKLSTEVEKLMSHVICVYGTYTGSGVSYIYTLNEILSYLDDFAKIVKTAYIIDQWNKTNPTMPKVGDRIRLSLTNDDIYEYFVSIKDAWESDDDVVPSDVVSEELKNATGVIIEDIGMHLFKVRLDDAYLNRLISKIGRCFSDAHFTVIDNSKTADIFEAMKTHTTDTGLKIGDVYQHGNTIIKVIDTDTKENIVKKYHPNRHNNTSGNFDDAKDNEYVVVYKYIDDLEHISTHVFHAMFDIDNQKVWNKKTK